MGRGLTRNHAHAQSINAVKETAMQSYRRTTPPTPASVELSTTYTVSISRADVSDSRIVD